MFTHRDRKLLKRVVDLRPYGFLMAPVADVAYDAHDLTRPKGLGFAVEFMD
jgi:hypothetical protein